MHSAKELRRQFGEIFDDHAASVEDLSCDTERLKSSAADQLRNLNEIKGMLDTSMWRMSNGRALFQDDALALSAIAEGSFSTLEYLLSTATIAPNGRLTGLKFRPSPDFGSGDFTLAPVAQLEELKLLLIRSFAPSFREGSESYLGFAKIPIPESVRTLSLDFNYMPNLSWLEGPLPRVEHLFLRSNSFTDLSSIKGLAGSLRTLDLSWNHSLRDISSLESFSKLEVLSIELAVIKNPEALPRLLPQLKTLHIPDAWATAHKSVVEQWKATYAVRITTDPLDTPM